MLMVLASLGQEKEADQGAKPQFQARLCPLISRGPCCLQASHSWSEHITDGPVSVSPQGSISELDTEAPYTVAEGADKTWERASNPEEATVKPGLVSVWWERLF